MRANRPPIFLVRGLYVGPLARQHRRVCSFWPFGVRFSDRRRFVLDHFRDLCLSQGDIRQFDPKDCDCRRCGSGSHFSVQLGDVQLAAFWGKGKSHVGIQEVCRCENQAIHRGPCGANGSAEAGVMGGGLRRTRFGLLRGEAAGGPAATAGDRSRARLGARRSQHGRGARGGVCGA